MNRPVSTIPRQRGYRMPAEWEPHAATWLAWPHNRQTWPGRYDEIPPLWLELAATLAESETVNVLAAGGQIAPVDRAALGEIANVVLHDIQTNDAWIRDFGPLFLLPDGAQCTQHAPQLVAVDWRYNAWGEKYPPFDDDQRAGAQVALAANCEVYRPGIVLEGGSIDVNGRGSVLVTESCLLAENRNPELSRRQVETYLGDYLGAPHVLWLGEGIAGDDTDGHVDDLARFVGEKTVVAVVEEDPRDENFKALADNLDRLRTMNDQDGRRLEVVTLPMPRAQWADDGSRLPASYANFYIANGVVVVPQFADPADAIAVDILTRLFPDRRIQAVCAANLVAGLGAVHCVTLQQPSLSDDVKSSLPPLMTSRSEVADFAASSAGASNSRKF